MKQSLQRLHVHEILRRKIPDKLYRYLINFKYERLGNRMNAEKLRRLSYPWKFGVSDSALFELVVEPNWITHQRVVMPEVESRLAEIEAHMYATRGWERYYRLKGYRKWRYSKYDLRLDERRARQIEKEWREFAIEDAHSQTQGTASTVPFSLPMLVRIGASAIEWDQLVQMAFDNLGDVPRSQTPFVEFENSNEQGQLDIVRLRGNAFHLLENFQGLLLCAFVIFKILLLRRRHWPEKNRARLTRSTRNTSPSTLPA